MELLIQRAFDAQGQAERHGITLAPRVPILYFGDRPAYQASPLRVVTAAINPSSPEFPATDPFERFPAWRDATETLPADPARYLQALNRYFHEVPYVRWFRHWAPVLEGFDAGFDGRHSHVALHTDFATPVATHPTWGKIASHDVRHALLEHGVDLWHALVSELRPHIVLMSSGASWLEQVRFTAPRDWEVKHEVPRGRTFARVLHRTVEIPGKISGADAWKTDFVFCSMYRQPFGGITHAHQRTIGPALRRRLTHW